MGDTEAPGTEAAARLLCRGRAGLQHTRPRRRPGSPTPSLCPGSPDSKSPALEIKVTLAGLDPKHIFINCLLRAQPRLGPPKASSGSKAPACLGKPWPNMLSYNNSGHKAAGGPPRAELGPEGQEPSQVISLLNGLATGSSLQLPPEKPRRSQRPPSWSSSFSQQLALSTSPARGCRTQGQGAGDELSLPCPGTKAASGPGAQLGSSCRLTAWHRGPGGERTPCFEARGFRMRQLLPVALLEPRQHGRRVAGGWPAGAGRARAGPPDHGVWRAAQEVSVANRSCSSCSSPSSWWARKTWVQSPSTWSTWGSWSYLME